MNLIEEVHEVAIRVKHAGDDQKKVIEELLLRYGGQLRVGKVCDITPGDHFVRLNTFEKVLEFGNNDSVKNAFSPAHCKSISTCPGCADAGTAGHDDTGEGGGFAHGHARCAAHGGRFAYGKDTEEAKSQAMASRSASPRARGDV